MCHNACVWLAIQIKQSMLLDYNIYIIQGEYKGLDHSWIGVETEDGQCQYLDMTLDQFEKVNTPVVCFSDNPNYKAFNSINLCDTKNLRKFVEQLGD